MGVIEGKLYWPEDHELEARAAPEAGGEHGQVAEEEAGVGRGQLPGADLLLLHPNRPVLPHLNTEQLELQVRENFVGE